MPTDARVNLPLKGIGLKLASVVVFVVMAALIKIVANHVPAGETVFSGVAEVYAPSQKEQLSLPEVPLVAVQQHDLFEGYIQRCQQLAPLKTAVAHPCDASSLSSVVQAAQQGLMAPILVGPLARIEALAQQLELDISGFEKIDMPHSEESAERAVALVREGRAATH